MTKIALVTSASSGVGGNAVIRMSNLLLYANVFSMNIMATTMPFVGRG